MIYLFHSTDRYCVYLILFRHRDAILPGFCLWWCICYRILPRSTVIVPTPNLCSLMKDWFYVQLFFFPYTSRCFHATSSTLFLGIKRFHSPRLDTSLPYYLTRNQEGKGSCLSQRYLRGTGLEFEDGSLISGLKTLTPTLTAHT